MHLVPMLFVWYFLMTRLYETQYGLVVGPFGSQPECQRILEMTRAGLGRRANGYLFSDCWHGTE